MGKEAREKGDETVLVARIESILNTGKDLTREEIKRINKKTKPISTNDDISTSRTPPVTHVHQPPPAIPPASTSPRPSIQSSSVNHVNHVNHVNYVNHVNHVSHANHVSHMNHMSSVSPRSSSSTPYRTSSSAKSKKKKSSICIIS